MNMKKPDFAGILLSIETASAAVDDMAKKMLSAIKFAQADTLIDFNEMVSDAYAKNGWSQVIGRPMAGAELKPAPDAVKMYVSVVRAAYRLDLEVTSYETMGALRMAIKEKRALNRAPKPTLAPEMKDVQIRNEHEMTGALWHDVIVLWEHLPENSQTKFEEQMRKLLTQYVKAAPEFLKLVA
jgi:hypothetical protein